MKRLSKHILSLLRLYDSVALPQTGVFRLRYVPAELNRESFSFFPPRFELIFVDFQTLGEEESGLNDGVLLDSYIRKEDLSPSEAESVLNGDLAEFRNYLSFGGNPVLKEFDLLNPPLPSVSLAPDKSDQGVIEPEDSVISDIDPVDDDLEDDYLAGLEDDDSDDIIKSSRRSWKNPNYYYIPIHKKVANIAACLLLVVIVGWAAWIPLDHSGNSKATASIVPITVADSNKTEDVAAPVSEPDADSQMAADAVEAEDASADATVDRTVPGAESLPSSPFVESVQPADKYFAVVAAFKTEKEAHKFIEEAKGDKGRFQIIRNSKFYMISVASSSSKEELEGNMPLIRSSFPDAWIFILK